MRRLINCQFLNDPFLAERQDFKTYPAYTPDNDVRELGLTRAFFADHKPTNEFSIKELKDMWRKSVIELGYDTKFFNENWGIVDELLQNPGYYQMMVDYETWLSPSYFGYIVDTRTGQMAKSMEVAFGYGTNLNGDRFEIPKDDISRWIMLRLPAFVYFRWRAMTVAGKMRDSEKELLIDYDLKSLASVFIGGGRFPEGRFCNWEPNPNHAIHIIEMNKDDNVYKAQNIKFHARDYRDLMFSGRFDGKADNAVFTGGVPYLLTKEAFYEALEGALRMLRIGGKLYVDDLVMTPCTANGVMTQQWGRFVGATKTITMQPNNDIKALENKFVAAVEIISKRTGRKFVIEELQSPDVGANQPYGALLTIKRTV